MSPRVARVFKVAGRALILLLFLSGSLLPASITLPAIFSDHMVLQQGVTLPVWGKADPGEAVFVRVSGESGMTTADATGTWRVVLRPLPRSSDPTTLVVQGKNRMTIHDVLLGDVWMCAGEENMEFPLSDAVGGKNDPAQTADQELRFFISEKQVGDKPQFGGSGSWVVCNSDTATNFSAVGYFFARDLRSVAHLPIGIIQCTWADTPVQSWISHHGLEERPSFLPTHDAGSGIQEQNVSAVFNAMIHPLVPYAITGTIWYHGESQEGIASREYRRLFPRLIRDWRKAWGQGPFPFLFVQLPGFGDGEGPVVESLSGENGRPRQGWPWIREGAACALALPNTGMAVTTDLGLADELQPPDKLDVGRRLALLARKRVYGENLVDSGPSFRSMRIEGEKIRVEWNSVGSGLTVASSPFQSGDSPVITGTVLKGFAIAGNDHKWFPATAAIEGASVILSSDAVPHPEAIRYNWSGYPQGNLYNKEGLPAAPFRSDGYQPE